MEPVPPPPLGGAPLPEVPPVAAGSGQAAGVANALAGSQQPGPPNAPPPAPQALQEPQDQGIPPHIRAEKGQILFSVLKLLGLVVLSPILLPLAGCKLLGWTLMALGNDSPAAFKADVAKGAHDTFKPLTRQWDGIIGGIIGVSGKGYRMIKKHKKEEAEGQQPPAPPPPPASAAPGAPGQAEEDRVMAAGGVAPGAAPPRAPPPTAGMPPPPANMPASQDAERRRQEDAERARRDAASQSSSVGPPPNRPPPAPAPPPRDDL